MWRPSNILSLTFGGLTIVSRKRRVHSKPNLVLIRTEDLPPDLRRGWLTVKLTLGQALVVTLFFALIVSLGIWETRTSGIEAALATRLGKALTYEVETGKSQQVSFPKDAPYDTTLGYSRIPYFTRRLGNFGFDVTEQARLSQGQALLVKAGLSPIYQEKSVHGLRVLGSSGEAVSVSMYPALRYRTLAKVPRLVTLSLLFIEDRHLLERQDVPSMNPAVSWERLSKATIDLIFDKIFRDRNVPGGSTLATQIEKFRHSPDGRTKTPWDKLRQMSSATARAYLLGEDTRVARDQIILDYMNEVPLGAVPGLGEIKGLGEALRAWFGVEFSDINKALETDTREISQHNRTALLAKAAAFKKVLALFLSQRRPAYYLKSGQKDLADLANSYIRLMQKSRLIESSLAVEALRQPLNILPPSDLRLQNVQPSFLDRKATNAVRIDLKRLLGVRTMYELDRLDLNVNSTFNADLQQQISSFLNNLKQRDYASTAGLFGERMLRPGQEAMVDYSFTLIERQDDFNAVRVQTDTLDSPLDLNRGGKLELGSTAKLRTLLTYLELIAEAHTRVLDAKNKGESLEQLLATTPDSDTMSRWVIQWNLDQKGETSLPEILNGALSRPFSASPWQAFRTGGGLITFGNFDSEENHQDFSVLEAFQRSNNLVFVRVMQEVVSHVIMTRIPEAPALLADKLHPKRRQYLNEFVELEGTAFVRSFYKQFIGKTTDERIALLAQKVGPTPSRLGALLLSLRPDLDYVGFRIAMLEKFPEVEDKVLLRYWSTRRPGIMSLEDRAFVVRTNPIALWMVRYLDQNPRAGLSDLLFDSLSIRKKAYVWLTDKAGSQRQEREIRTILEREAFQKHIIRYWQRQGFPFKQMVPSLASALGSSGDRPSALADLMGAIQNYGVMLPTRRIEELRFAADTPYETALGHAFSGARRVVRPEVAEAAQVAVRAVVEGGTARRLKGSLHRSDGIELSIAAKTGTGDNRLDSYGSDGRLIKSDAKSRTATLVFAIGDRFFGAITAYVKAEDADVDDFAFTSSLVVQAVKSMMPMIAPHVLKVEDPWSLAFQ
jgi:membrane peptidoglycan carboxypeptidase